MSEKDFTNPKNLQETRHALTIRRVFLARRKDGEWGRSLPASGGQPALGEPLCVASRGEGGACAGGQNGRESRGGENVRKIGFLRVERCVSLGFE